MSEYFFADMVRETCVDTGAGALALAGRVPGFRRFADAVPTGAVFPYAIQGVANRSQWETGSGSIDDDGRLVRVALASSAGGVAVDFAPGLKTVALSVGADWYASAGQSDPVGIADIAGLEGSLASKEEAIAAANSGQYWRGDKNWAALDKAAVGLGLVDNSADADKNVAAAARLAEARTISATGDVSWSVSFDGAEAASAAATIPPGRIDNVRLATMAGGTIKGRAGSSGAPQDLSASEARGVLGLGSAALRDTGTSGATVPKLDSVTVSFGGTVNATSWRATGVSETGFTGKGLAAYVIAGSGVMQAFDYTIAVYLPLRLQGSAVELVAEAAVVARADATGLTPGGDASHPLGSPARRWDVVHAASGTINTSDAHAKKYIGAIPKTWLDAWGDVAWRRYKFRAGDGVKGGRRWHIGLIAQQVSDAFALRGIDAFAIGLLCRDALPGGATRWGLRYDECAAIEAAWQRRELARIEKRLVRIEMTAKRRARCRG